MQIIDKNNGKPLFEPWLPTYPACQTKELIEEYCKAKDYFFQNGIPQKKYDEFLEWKKEAASKGVPDYMLTYDEYEAACAREEIAESRGQFYSEEEHADYFKRVEDVIKGTEEMEPKK